MQIVPTLFTILSALLFSIGMLGIFLNRRNQIENLDRNKGYLSSAIASNFIRTMGECFGVFYGIVGTTLSILGLFMNRQICYSMVRTMVSRRCKGSHPIL